MRHPVDVMLPDSIRVIRVSRGIFVFPRVSILPAGKVEIRVRTGHVVGEGGGVGEVVLAVVAVPVRLVPVEPLALLRFLRFAESPEEGTRNHK